MESLNDIIERSIEANKRNFLRKNIVVLTKLEPSIPKIYEDDTIGTNLNKALTQLTLELEDAKPKNAIYKTAYNERVQKLIIYHDGNKIPQHDLHHLNDSLKDIAEGKKD